MKNFILAFGLILLITASCRSTRDIAKEYVYVHDTVTKNVTVKERDTVIVKAESKASIQVPIENFKNGYETSFSNKDAKGTAKVKNDTVYLECKCDSLNLTIKLRDTQIETLEKVIKEFNTPRPEDTSKASKGIPWYINILAWVGGIALLLIVSIVLLKKFKVIK